MTEENREMNLRIASIYPSQSARTRLNVDSGAGANADSKIDMAFVASDPLSELVWSPHKGLILKCADCSFSEKKNSCLGDVGPSNIAHSQTHSTRSMGECDDKPIGVRNVSVSEAEIHLTNEHVTIDFFTTPPKSSTGLFLDLVLHTNQSDYLFEHDNESAEFSAGKESREEADFYPLLANDSQRETLSGKISGEDMTNHSSKNKGFSSDSQMLDLEIALAPQIHAIDRRNVLNDPMSKSLSLKRTPDDSGIVVENSKNNIEGQSSKDVPLESLESSAENDIPHLISKDTCRISEGKSQMGNDSPVEVSGIPISSRIPLLHMKGKEKVVFGTDVVARTEKDDDDSHDSVESCSSARLASRRKRQWGFGQQLIVGSKRIKSQILESPTATSLVKQDSSFMNWISNMVKGLAKVNRDACTLALSPSHEVESYDQKNDTSNRTRESGYGNMGFQSIFQRLCSNTNLCDTKMSNVSYPVSGVKELVEADKTCISVMPISFCREIEDSSQKCMVESNNLNHDTSGNGRGLSSRPSFQPQILSADAASTQETCKSLSSESKNLSSLAFIKDKNVSSSLLLLGKLKCASSTDTSSHSQCEGKAIPDTCTENDPLRSLWITRFSSKPHCTVSILDRCGSTHVMLEHPAGSTNHISQNHVDSPFPQKDSQAMESSAEGLVNAACNDTQKDATSTDTSMGVIKVCGHKYEKPIRRLQSPSPVLKGSEALTSLFAKRVEALQNITPSDGENLLKTTCYFCGKSGHNIRNCTEVNRTELEDLLRSINSHDVVEGSPCVCLKCFQLGHWAVACPAGSSSWHRPSNNEASVFHHCDSSTVQLHKGTELGSRIFVAKESHPLVGEYSSCNEKIPRTENVRSLRLVSKGKMVSDGRDLCLDEVQRRISSSYKEIKITDIQITPFSDSAIKPISGEANMFAAIRRIRLSRMDILNWMKSHKPLSCLDGFFLRVRITKWENGVAGSEYYVACINEIQREKEEDSKNSLYVKVGGIHCLVESRYISNHDFSEDELMIWWQSTSESGEKPTEDDLMSKFEERQKLGI